MESSGLCFVSVEAHVADGNDVSWVELGHFFTDCVFNVLVPDHAATALDAAARSRRQAARAFLPADPVDS